MISLKMFLQAEQFIEKHESEYAYRTAKHIIELYNEELKQKLEVQNSLNSKYSRPSEFFIKIKENGSFSGYWYDSLKGKQFLVRKAYSRSDTQEMEGFGGFDLDKILIVKQGEFAGNAIYLDHCESEFENVK